MLNRLIRFIARAAYRQGYADGYLAGRGSRQQQSYAQGYREGKAEHSELRATRAKLDEAFEWGYQQGLIAQADATAGSSQGIVKTL